MGVGRNNNNRNYGVATPSLVANHSKLSYRAPMSRTSLVTTPTPSTAAALMVTTLITDVIDADCDSISGTLIAEALFQCLIVFLSIVGNVLVLLSLALFHRLRAKKSNVIFVLSLAVADFLVAVGVMPFHIVQTVIGYWPFGQVFCDIFIANDVFFCTASLLGIMCIAVERYVAVFKPLRYKAMMTTRVAIWMISLAWVLSLLISYIPIHLNLHVMSPSEARNNTTDATMMPALVPKQDEKCGFAVNPTYAVVSSVISYWLPTGIMIFVYLRMYVAAKKQLGALSQAAPGLPSAIHHFSADEEPSSQIKSTDERSGFLSRQSIALQFSKRKMSIFSNRKSSSNRSSRALSMAPHSLRTEVTLGRILGCFVVCWSPFFTLLVVDSAILETPLDPDEYDWLFKAVLWIGYVNSAANPFIYALSNREFEPLWQRIKATACCGSDGLSGSRRRLVATPPTVSSVKTNSTSSTSQDAPTPRLIKSCPVFNKT